MQFEAQGSGKWQLKGYKIEIMETITMISSDSRWKLSVTVNVKQQMQAILQ